MIYPNNECEKKNSTNYYKKKMSKTWKKKLFDKNDPYKQSTTT